MSFGIFCKSAWNFENGLNYCTIVLTWDDFLWGRLQKITWCKFHLSGRRFLLTNPPQPSIESDQGWTKKNTLAVAVGPKKYGVYPLWWFVSLPYLLSTKTWYCRVDNIRKAIWFWFWTHSPLPVFWTRSTRTFFPSFYTPIATVKAN